MSRAGRQNALSLSLSLSGTPDLRGKSGEIWGFYSGADSQVEEVSFPLAKGSPQISRPGDSYDSDLLPRETG